TATAQPRLAQWLAGPITAAARRAGPMPMAPRAPGPAYMQRGPLGVGAARAGPAAGLPPGPPRRAADYPWPETYYVSLCPWDYCVTWYYCSYYICPPTYGCPATYVGCGDPTYDPVACPTYIIDTCG